MNTSEKLGMTGLVIGGAAICFSIAQSIRLTKISKFVRDVIERTASNIDVNVSDSIIAEAVARLDISELRTEVKKEAKEKILAKFDGDLDGILTEFNQNLANVQKIYTSIAENISKK